MRIRTQIAGAFGCLLLLSAYLGFSKDQYIPVNDKVLHFLCFFLMTLCFYWLVDTSRRRILNFTLIVMFGILGVGSEFLQGALPWRTFDPYDILANLVGCSAGLGLSLWYHKRMLERKRQAKTYQPVGNEDEAELGIIEEEDEEDEVGESSTGKVHSSTGPQIDGEVGK